MRHYLVFVGASTSLSDELRSLEKRQMDTIVIAPAAKKGDRGLTRTNVDRASKELIAKLQTATDNISPARLSVWSFLPAAAESIELLWHAFGRSAWIEYLPSNLIDKDRQSRVFVEQRLPEVIRCLHLIYLNAIGGRKTSPVALPFENFRSNVTNDFQTYWYRGLREADVKKALDRINVNFRQLHSARGRHRDERRLLFSPALDTECHGKPHPTGSSMFAFINGRFRFGSALFPGFHYDVRHENARTLEVILVDAEGRQRSMKSEKREYINIYPNNHLLPES